MEPSALPPPPTDWEIPGAEGQPILGTTHPPAGRPRGVIVIAHGFKGYKDYGLLPRLADEAARRGLIAHRFNFSHSGMTRRTETFERPDLFERDTWDKQVRDLTAVVAATRSGVLAGRGLALVLLGHSRGGLTSLLTAAGLEARGEGVAGVIAAASPADACRLDEPQCQTLRAAGRLASPSGRTGQTLYVGGDWLAEIEADPEAVDPVAAAGRIAAPMLIIHGDADQTVPLADADRLARAARLGAAGGRARQEVIAGATHTFNAPNPLPPQQDPPPRTRRLIELALNFAAKCAAQELG